MLLFLGESMKKLPYFERNCRFWSESVCRLLFICLILMEKLKNRRRFWMSLNECRHLSICINLMEKLENGRILNVVK
jgi:hypothetical protein